MTPLGVGIGSICTSYHFNPYYQTFFSNLYFILCFIFPFLFFLLDDLPSAKRLLQKIVPLGSMPSMPDGFPSLSELKTDNFDYNINKGKVTVIADLENPVKLLGQGLTINDVKMTFKYDKNNPGGKWKFDAEGKLELRSA